MKHILYAEDREDDVFFLQRACQRAGLQEALRLHAVADGQLAIDYLSGIRDFADREKHPLPDLALLDLKMPHRSGLEVLEWIRNHSVLNSLPVFLLTSSNQQADVQRAHQLGATGYLTKPSSIAELAEFVAKIAAVLGVHARSIAPASAPSRSAVPTSATL